MNTETDPATDSNTDERLNAQRARMGHCTAVVSGKGGVGKSTVAVNLAVALSQTGLRVGLIDVDIHGPSVPTMLGLRAARMAQGPNGIAPVAYRNLSVASIGFMLQDEDEAVIWRGPLKNNLIRKFIEDVDWGELDHLIVDCPPGTGDEPLSVCQLLGGDTSALIVTTPQEVAAADVRRCIRFCEELKLPVVGLVENMSGFCCPECRKVTHIFSHGGGEKLCAQAGLVFLGRIPIDASICAGADRGLSLADAPVPPRVRRTFDPIVEAVIQSASPASAETLDASASTVPGLIAVPIADGTLCNHFGHCESFALLEIASEGGGIGTRTDLEPPPHEPGVLPQWLAGKGVATVIAGGMGSRAQTLFTEAGITVVTGAPQEEPEALAIRYLEGALETGTNVCDH